MSLSSPSLAAVAGGVASALLGFLLGRYFAPPGGGGRAMSFDDSDLEDCEPLAQQALKGSGRSHPSQWGVANAPYKLVFCVNKTLGMTHGKVAAQCCHAAVGCYKRATKLYPHGVRAWEYTGCAKVALKIDKSYDALEEMNKVVAKCKEMGVAYYLVEDAGRTQIEPGSRTVVGVGPGPVDVIDEITSQYKLY